MAVPLGYFLIREAASRLVQELHFENADTTFLTIRGTDVAKVIKYYDSDTTAPAEIIVRNNDSDETARYEIAVALANKALRCAGLFPDGRIVSIDEIWPTEEGWIQIALRDKLIPISVIGKFGYSSIDATPIIPAQDFKSCFKCDGYFPLPRDCPAEWEESAFRTEGHEFTNRSKDATISGRLIAAPITPANMIQVVPAEKATKWDPAAHDKIVYRPRNGRPPKHDWDAFWIEVTYYAAANDLDTEHRAELQQHMEKWAVSASPDDPMDSSTIRKKLQKLFAPRAPK